MTEQKSRILIVDDERLNITVLAALLEDEYEIIVAKNGTQALQRAQAEQKPDLILLDVVMPDMDGYEVCQQLKADPHTQHIPIIFITVKSTVEEEARGLEMGAVDYIVKPFSPAIAKARVANHIELKRQRDLLQHLNITDGLTGIGNRRYFDGYLEHELEDCIDRRSVLSLIMIDIDDFKEFNDNHGHTHGDQCLKIVAKTLEKCTERSSDLVARYGGEEFAVILPGIDNRTALNMAENMRKHISQLAIPINNSSINVTISLGVSTCHERQSPNALIEQADRALYQSKNDGRNRVTVAS